MDKIVAVHWIDPTIEPGWVNDEDHTTELPVFISYGVLISKTKKQVVIAGTIAPESKKDRYADRTKFPAGCVKKIDFLTTLKQQREKDEQGT